MAPAKPTRLEIKRDMLKLLKAQAEVDALVDADALHVVKNIQITYPGFLRWYESYDDNLHDGTLAGKIRRYRFKKKAHENWISKIIARIQRSQAGSALMAEIFRAKSNLLSIYPQSGDDDASDDADDEEDATFKGDAVRNTDGTPRGTRKGTGYGSDATIEFSPEKWSRLVGSSGMTGPGGNADEVLFHELVHACRDLNGKSSLNAVNEEYLNEEEFISIVVTNIYLAEKGQSDMRSNHTIVRKQERKHRMVLKDPERFLDQPNVQPRPRVMLERLRVRQQHFFHELAAIPADAAWFNPVREYNEELRKQNSRPKRRAS